MLAQDEINRLELLIKNGNGLFRSYSCSDHGSLWSYFLSVRSFWSGSFRPDFRGGSFRPNFSRSFWPTLFYIVLLCVEIFLASLD